MSMLFFQQLNIFLPVFLLGAGGVLLVDGLLIYRYYQHNSGAPLLFCSDIHGTGLTRIDIHGMENYVAIEFAGVFVALVFYVRDVVCQISFCSSNKLVTPTIDCGVLPL